MDDTYPGSSISFTPKGGLSIPHWARGVKRGAEGQVRAEGHL